MRFKIEAVPHACGAGKLVPYFRLPFADIEGLFEGSHSAPQDPGKTAQNEGHIGGGSDPCPDLWNGLYDGLLTTRDA